MQSQQQILKIGGTAATGVFPSAIAYNLIFLTATILSVLSVAFATMMVRNRQRQR
jgi:hypothetical protein